jgi:hypothetical protein
MILVWIGFIVLIVVGLGMTLAGLIVSKMIMAFGGGGWWMPIVQFAAAGICFWLAYNNAPFYFVVK